jgi:hypothetical protein
MLLTITKIEPYLMRIRRLREAGGGGAGREGGPRA